MTFDPLHYDLPVKEIIPQVKNLLNSNNTIIVHAPPGAGKSTILPLALLNEPWLAGKKIIMLEPRRLAAKTISYRMASLLGEEPGKTVGFRIRFETCISVSTRIEVVTEGILTRMIHGDKSLDGVAMVIFDEFHERSIHADVAMALCRESQRMTRPDLKIMVMSATLNMEQLPGLLNAPVAESQGKQYPVEIKYTGTQSELLLPELTAKVILKASKEKAGDILAFLPGESEIKQCEKILRRELKNSFSIHPLYGQLPPGKQFSAIMPAKNGKRKIVLATSIAETSLTIEGITVVVDSGYSRTSRFDPKTGLSRLETIKIARDSASQRAGRAGRLSPGTCYRMWAESEQEHLNDFSTPEILEADLCSLVLDMAQWNILDVNQLTWLSPPPRAALLLASETLHQLDALEDGKITSHGKEIHALPCHPRIAHMLLKAKNSDQIPLASDIAAIVEERDPLPRETGIDINLRIVALQRFRKENGESKKLKKIEKVAKHYRNLFDVSPENEESDPYETGVLLAYCYPERIAFARPGNNAQFQLANGKYASAHHKDDLAHEPWLAIATLDAREGMGKIYLASPLNPKDLASMVKEQVVIRWDPEDGELTASKDIRIGNIVLKSKPLPEPDERHKVKAISDALKKEGENLLSFDEKVKRLQKAILQLRKSNPHEGWPDVSTPALLITNNEWLGPYLTNIEMPEELKTIDLVPLIENFLNSEKKERLKIFLSV